MAYNRLNHLERVRAIQDFARKLYEPGRQDRCWRWVWMHHVRDRFHLDYHTFLNMLKIDVDKDVTNERKRLTEKSLKGTFFDGEDF